MRERILTGAMAITAALFVCAPAAAQGPKPKIIFGNNPLYDSSNAKSSPCSATTIKSAELAKRKSTVDWLIKNGDLGLGIGKCTNAVKFKDGLVTVEFDSPSPIGPQTNNGSHITAAVLDTAADGAYHYRVLYDGNKAEDPELDVKGDGPFPPISTTGRGRGRGAAPQPKRK